MKSINGLPAHVFNSVEASWDTSQWKGHKRSSVTHMYMDALQPHTTTDLRHRERSTPVHCVSLESLRKGRREMEGPWHLEAKPQMVCKFSRTVYFVKFAGVGQKNEHPHTKKTGFSAFQNAFPKTPGSSHTRFCWVKQIACVRPGRTQIPPPWMGYPAMWRNNTAGDPNQRWIEPGTFCDGGCY